MMLQRLTLSKILQVVRVNALLKNFSIMSVEVEQKFHFDSHVVKRLLELGAKFKKEVTFRDVYYDTPSSALMCRDHWLRRRDGQWELKSPPENEYSTGSAGQYHELDTEESISTALVKALEIHKLNSSVQAVQLEELLQKCSVSPFADFTTTRKKYTIEGLAVDLDETNFGYNVGEIEVIAEDVASVESAHSKIQQFVTSLGVGTTSYVPGKVVAYMWLHQRERFEAIVQAGISGSMPDKLVEQVLNKL